MARSARVFPLTSMVATGAIDKSATGFKFTRTRALSAAGVSVVKIAADKIKVGDLVFFSNSPTATAEVMNNVFVPLTRGEATRLNGKSYSSTAKFDVIRFKNVR